MPKETQNYEIVGKKEKEEAARRAERSRVEAEEERKRSVEAAKRKEQERMKAVIQSQREEEARQLAKSLKERGTLKADIDVRPFNISNLKFKLKLIFW